MKKLFFGISILIANLTCSVAVAYNGFDQAGYCLPPYSYQGFKGLYLGGNLGVITQFAFRNEDTHAFVGKTFINADFTIGAQAGYDWNFGCKLFGLIADWDWSTIDQSHTNTNGDQIKDKLDWYLTLRGRTGVTVQDCLFYVTAGAAAAHFETYWNPNSTNHFRKDALRWGWAGGGGIEYLLGFNWSMGAEILFMQFDLSRKSYTSSSGTTYNLGTNDSIWLGRVTLNYHFGAFSCFCRR